MSNISHVQAQKALHEEKYEEGSLLYDKLLAADPNDLELLLGKANCLIFQCQWTDCFKYLARAVKNKNWKVSLLNDVVSNIVKTLTVRNETSDSKGPFQFSPEVVHQNFLCAVCCQLLHNPTTILCGHTFCKACVLKQEKCTYCSNLRCEADGRSPNFVLSNIGQTCFKAKTKAGELRCKGNDHFSQQQYQDAFKFYNEALQLDPTNHLILSNLSYTASLLGDHQSALGYAEKACLIMPHWDKAFYRKACALVGLKNFSLAAIAYLQLLLINPKSDYARTSLNKVLIEMLTHEDSEKRSDERSWKTSNVMLGDLASYLDILLNEQSHNTKDADVKSGYPLENESVLSNNLRISDFECSLCCRMFYHPVTCPCGHTFCQWCLNRCLDHSPSCPICRYPMEKYISSQNQNVTVMMEFLCEKYFPDEFKERKMLHEEELKKLASVASDTAENIPVFVCTLAIPTVPCPLHIFEPRYRHMVRECMESGSRQFGMCIPNGDNNRFSDYGVMLEIQEFSLLSDGRSLVQTIGGRRFKPFNGSKAIPPIDVSLFSLMSTSCLLKMFPVEYLKVLGRGMKDGYHTAQVEWLKDSPIAEDELNRITSFQLRVYENVKKWLSSLPWFMKIRVMQMAGDPPECDHGNTSYRNGPNWIWWCVNLLPMEPSLKLEIIAMTNVRQRLDKIQDYLDHLA